VAQLVPDAQEPRPLQAQSQSDAEPVKKLVQPVPEVGAAMLLLEHWVQQAREAAEVLQLKAGFAKARVELGMFATLRPEPLGAALFWC
jgi:hypothetical protein